VSASRTVRLGTRASRLALAQTELVADRLRGRGWAVELVKVRTTGDDRPPGTSPGEGMFVTALVQALERDEIDLAAHSAKDLPLEEPPGIATVHLDRADPRDALITREGGATLDSLAHGEHVGTDSPRRAGFLQSVRPDLDVRPLQGNVDTRLRKLDEGQVGALALAAAGLDRLGLAARIDCRLEPSVVPPAPGQGALAAQVRRADAEMLAMAAELAEPDVALAVRAERLLLAAMGGGCRSPLGALGEVRDGRLHLLAGLPGYVVRVEGSADEEGAAVAATAAARELTARGAGVAAGAVPPRLPNHADHGGREEGVHPWQPTQADHGGDTGGVPPWGGMS
jgi:hydroxymethylbilane synthase